MGSYGIGSGRLLACIAEEYHDEFGLALPITVAPYHIHLVVLPGKSKSGDKPIIDQDPKVAAERLYSQLINDGFEVLFDDRDLSPGIKFADADLIGIPIRLTISNRSLSQGGVEFKLRNSNLKTIILLDGIKSNLNEIIISLEDDIAKKIKPEHLDL
jgi:prolyl-tRNA synthetase